MKIAILRQRISGPGGAETTLGHLARGLVRAGHEVTLLGVSGQEQSAAALGPGFRYVPVTTWGGKTGRLLTFALNSRRLLRNSRFDAILSLERTLCQQFYRAGDGCHREWLARRAPYLSWPSKAAMQVNPFHRLMLYLEARLFADPGLRRVIANSHQVKEEIIRHYRLEPERIKVIYNGLDHGRFRPLPERARRELLKDLGAPPGVRILLFVGSGFNRKGLAYLIEAFSGLNDKGLQLWVVGKGDPGPYRRRAERTGAADRLRFFGPRQDVASFYQAASVLALPTIYDPCSNVVLEALACGTPVVTTTGNGAREFITPGDNGAVLARPYDIPALQEGLAFFLNRGDDPQVRQAAHQAVAHLGWADTVAQTLAVLEESFEFRVSSFSRKN
ncbi:MAG: glycosyltransferase family 4 protein [Deltaproteobacteria bacterium]|nr:glycosyltransferase family 4 protein [Deltaproteobacteria bacterium]